MRAVAAIVLVAAVGGWLTDTGSTSPAALLLAGLVTTVGSAALLRFQASPSAPTPLTGERATTILASTVWFLLPLTLVRVAEWLAAGDVVLVVLAAVVLVSGGPRSRAWDEIVRHPMVVGTVLLVGGATVGALNSAAPADSVQAVVNLAVGAAVPLVTVLRWNPDHDDRRRLFVAFALGAALSALVGVVYLRTLRGRALGLATHPNQLAMISVMALPLAYRAWTVVRGRMRPLVAGSAAALVAGIVLSGSRSGLVGLVVVGVLVTFRALREPAKALLVCAVIVVAGAVWWQSVDLGEEGTSVFARLEAEGGAATSNELREGLLEDELRRLASGGLVGSGLRTVERPHNVFLDVWTSTGIVGMAGFLLLCWHGVAGAVRSFTGDAPSGRRRALEGDLWAASVAFAGYLAVATFNNALWNRFIWAHVGVLASLRATWLLRQNDTSSS